MHQMASHANFLDLIKSVSLSRFFCHDECIGDA